LRPEAVPACRRPRARGRGQGAVYAASMNGMPHGDISIRVNAMPATFASTFWAAGCGARTWWAPRTRHVSSRLPTRRGRN